MSQILTLKSHILVLKSQLWSKVTAIKPIPFQPLLAFLSFLCMSQNSRYGEPTCQLVPNEGPARRNTIIQWKSKIPGRTTTERLFIDLTELLDQHRVFQHHLAALTDCQMEIFCWPGQNVLYRTKTSPNWSQQHSYPVHQFLVLIWDLNWMIFTSNWYMDEQ